MISEKHIFSKPYNPAKKPANPCSFNLSGFAKFANCQAIATQQGGLL